MCENKNIAIIDIKEYNRLRDFETNILAGKVLKLEYHYYRSIYLNVNEAIDELNKENELLQENNYSLRSEIESLNEKISKLILGYKIIEPKTTWLSKLLNKVR